MNWLENLSFRTNSFDDFFLRSIEPTGKSPGGFAGLIRIRVRPISQATGRHRRQGRPPNGTRPSGSAEVTGRVPRVSHPAFPSNLRDRRFRKATTPRRGQEQLYTILRNFRPKVLARVAAWEVSCFHVGRGCRQSNEEGNRKSCWLEGDHCTTTFAVPPMPMALAAA